MLYPTHQTIGKITSAISRGVGALRYYNADSEIATEMETAAEQLWALHLNAPDASDADYVGPIPVEVLARDIPPIAGGEPVYEPTAEEERDWTPMSLGLDREPIDEPTDADWDEYVQWSAALDAPHRDLYGY